MVCRRGLAGCVVLSVLTVGALGLVHSSSDAATGEAQPIVEPAGALGDHPVARMLGLWHGTVRRMGRDGEWEESVAIERARWNLAGTAILVEGYGFEDDPDTGERVVGHDAFGLIEWDDAAGAPVFHAHRAGAEFEAHAIESNEEGDGFGWEMSPVPGVAVRFTITLTAELWVEIGEVSRDDGETWTEFLAMDLKRAPSD